MKQTTRKRGAVVCLSLALSASVLGCAGGIPAKAMELSPQSLQDRQLQTRRFDTSDERALLVAAVGLAQDLGYGVDATELKLGVVVASKDRHATDGGQIPGGGTDSRADRCGDAGGLAPKDTSIGS